jgi:hypothetical protein
LVVDFVTGGRGRREDNIKMDLNKKLVRAWTQIIRLRRVASRGLL